MKKNKERKVMKEKDKVSRLVDMAYEDVKRFLTKNTKYWGKEKDAGSYVSYGLLNGVFEALFFLAPSKQAAMEIIYMSLMNFVSPDELWTDAEER